MNTEDRSQLQQILRRRRDVIADCWCKAVARTSYVPLSEAQVRGQLVTLTEEAIALLLTESLDHGRAEAIGASLAGLHYVQPEALSRTQEILAQQLIEGLPADQVVALQPRLAALLGELAAGFFQQSREIIRAEQEGARSALAAALRQAQEALQRSHTELELRAQERTAELAAANEQLRREITERKWAEEALREAKERFRTIVETAPCLLLISDATGNNIYVSPNCEEMTGYTQEELMGRMIWWVHEDDTPRAKEVFERTFREAVGNKNFEYKAVKKNGKVWYASSSWEAFRDERGEFKGVVLHTIDITERKRAEEQIKASLREKTVLLQEIHHRVKNNLAIVSSLLEWQSEMIKDERARAAFQDSQNRVRSMARIHESLYQSQDLARVDMAEYIEELVDYLRQSYGTYAIPLKVEAADVALALDTALPCGLIINELVSNAMKHAFPTGQPGDIHIALHSDKDQVELTVSDNGIGLPPDVDLEDPKSLGLTLVNLLTQQLRGKLEVDRDKGTTFRLNFAVTEERS